MSHNINGKDYGDYFKALEEQMNNKDMPKSESKAAVTKEKNATKAKTGGIYKVFRIRKGAVIIALTVVAAIVLCVTVIPSAGKKNQNDDGVFAIASASSGTADVEKTIEKIKYIFDDNTAEIPSSNDAESAIIIDTETHTVVAARQPDKRMYPASVTKIMTLLTACENIENYEDTFTMTLDITDPLFVAGASVAGFLNGEKITMTDMIYGLILPSGADAAVGLAHSIAGSEEAFVGLMNKKAEEMGLKNTHFMNTSGLFHKEHYTTAYDVAIILETALKNPICKKVLSTARYVTEKTDKHPEGIPLSATLFDYMYGTEPETATIMGGKTGYVSEAGYCIASYGANNTTDREYIVVTLKNSARRPAFHGQIALYKEFAK